MCGATNHTCVDVSQEAFGASSSYTPDPKVHSHAVSIVDANRTLFELQLRIR